MQKLMIFVVGVLSVNLIYLTGASCSAACTSNDTLIHSTTLGSVRLDNGDCLAVFSESTGSYWTAKDFCTSNLPQGWLATGETTEKLNAIKQLITNYTQASDYKAWLHADQVPYNSADGTTGWKWRLANSTSIGVSPSFFAANDINTPNPGSWDGGAGDTEAYLLMKRGGSGGLQWTWIMEDGWSMAQQFICEFGRNCSMDPCATDQICEDIYDTALAQRFTCKHKNCSYSPCLTGEYCLDTYNNVTNKPYTCEEPCTRSEFGVFHKTNVAAVGNLAIINTTKTDILDLYDCLEWCARCGVFCVSASYSRNTQTCHLQTEYYEAGNHVFHSDYEFVNRIG